MTQLDARHEANAAVHRLVSEANADDTAAGENRRVLIEEAITAAGLVLIGWELGEAVIYNTGIQPGRTHKISVIFAQRRESEQTFVTIRAVHGENEAARFLTCTVGASSLPRAVVAAHSGKDRDGVHFDVEQPFKREADTPAEQLVQAIQAIVRDTPQLSD